MKKKLLISFGILISVLFIILLTYQLKYKNSKKETKYNDNTTISTKKIKDKCAPFTGESFNIIFITNGGNEIVNMNVGVAANQDSYQDLPIPVKEGYNFEGWYFDTAFNNKVEVTNSKDINPIPEYDDNNCLIRYKDIELYANWIELPKEEINNSTQEVIQNVQVEEPPVTEEQSIPEEQIKEEEPPNTCEFKRPVEYGKYINYAMVTHRPTIPKYNNYIVTNRYATIYSITCGKVYNIRSYISNYNYAGPSEQKEKLNEIYTLSNIDGEFISIVYIDVAESNVQVGDIISNETVLGRASFMSKGVFIHSLPFINIYIQKGIAETNNKPNGEVINPNMFMSLTTEEFWENR